MVMLRSKLYSRNGALTTELLVAIAMMSIAMIPIAFGMVNEQKLLHAEYQRAVALEVIDGELEVLIAGEWRRIPEGKRRLNTDAKSARNFPSAHVLVTRSNQLLRVEWFTSKDAKRPLVTRQAVVP